MIITAIVVWVLTMFSLTIGYAIGRLSLVPNPEELDGD